ncbi:indolepyruvate oxidoreductase subunit beta [Holophaga foetida]|uniref:indolepyruvate oxidoreductase subunit beta n=1 Tax=Holophaga foetida TaxID=35839 RepID=UPI00024746A2|nr:indolepyruvate oxidoreductase subunit beta [Holophaga foetida]
MTKSIMLVGVGGQGTILAAKLLTVALMDAGYDVKMSEIHGMSQRGGSVSSQVRYGKEVHSPVIEEGGADILVAFEKMEAMRWLNYLKPSGKVVVNNWEIKSMPIVTGKVDYPKGIIEELQSKVPTTAIDAAKLASELGNSKVMNVILLGATVKSMGLDTLDWERIIKENVKPALAELNIKALKLGMAQV